ncbi:MAG: hypothetical protein MZW92_64030 [Comamonadaceae bacterium]|nr:hypothetical protein [Comamonadaceae bacterium]
MIELVRHPQGLQPGPGERVLGAQRHRPAHRPRGASRRCAAPAARARPPC